MDHRKLKVVTKILKKPKNPINTTDITPPVSTIKSANSDPDPVPRPKLKLNLIKRRRRRRSPKISTNSPVSSSKESSNATYTTQSVSTIQSETTDIDMSSKGTKHIKKSTESSGSKVVSDDGSSGYGNTTSSDIHTWGTAPEAWEYKFGYYFKNYPEDLQNRIQMDEIAAFSLTHPTFADDIARTLIGLHGISKKPSIIDATAGGGGNSMAFIKHFNEVISIELNSKRSGMLHDNLKTFKKFFKPTPRGNFNVLTGDYTILKNSHKLLQNYVDVIFLDPPWGGIGYKNKDNIRLKLSGKFMSEVCNNIKNKSRYIALKLPVKYNLNKLNSEISKFNGEIIKDWVIKNKKQAVKMLIVVIQYIEDRQYNQSNETISIKDSVSKSSEEKSSEDSSESSMSEDSTSTGKPRDRFDLSGFPFSYDTKQKCDLVSNQFPVITDAEEFYQLIPDDLVLNKPISVDKGSKPSELDLEIYQNLDKTSIINTFKYLFYKIRIGIFVWIKDNKLQYFIPFANQNFKNNWSDKINTRSRENYLNEYIHNKFTHTGRTETDLETDLSKWSSNNCLIGNWTGNEIGDMGWYELREILDRTCKKHPVNDCVFFFNRRDHPVLTPDRTEPYFHIFNNLTTPLTDHSYPNYVPILSYSKSDKFADLMFPNYADWRNVTGKIYPSSCTDMNMGAINHKWHTKHPQAVFRGSATGCGTTNINNQRINLSVLSKTWNKAGRNDLMDAGLVGKNLRDKKFMGKEMSFFRYRDYGLTMAKRLPMNEQSNFKYIIHVDGHVSAYRLGKELSLGCCILKVDSLFGYKLWFTKYLEQYIPRHKNTFGGHYLAINKDLSTLGNAILWCRSNDSDCKKIAENCGKLYRKIINEDFILNYSANIINSISHNFII